MKQKEDKQQHNNKEMKKTGEYVHETSSEQSYFKTNFVMSHQINDGYNSTKGRPFDLFHRCYTVTLTTPSVAVVGFLYSESLHLSVDLTRAH